MLGSFKTSRAMRELHTYSRVPNTSRVWNNGIGWKIYPKSIVVGVGINILGGKFTQN